MNLVFQKNDQKAKVLIWIFSAIVFVAVSVLERVTLDVSLPFNPHVFAAINAGINATVAVLLIAGLMTIKRKYMYIHRNLMLIAMGLSLIFLVTYILHHLLAGETIYGDLNHDFKLSPEEKGLVGNMRFVYYFLLGTHILLAGISLPFILFTAYRALTLENERHRKLAKITWPLWFYVAVTGPIVYLMISKYY